MRLFSSLLLLLVFITPFSLADATQPSSNQTSVCRDLAEDSARLACYDAIFGAPLTGLAQLPAAGQSQISEVKKRMDREDLLFDYQFAILPHRQTYILPYTYNEDPNEEPFSPIAGATSENQQLDNAEAKFQISFKVPLVDDFLIDDSTLWMGYTQLSLWQVYNSDASAPFRETNYEPEIFWTIPTDKQILGANLESVSVGFVHQSNGRGELLSRSWNRVYANFVLARDRWAFAFKPWYRIPEDEKDDDNPDIDDYVGYADFYAAYKWNDMTLSTQLRNNFRSTDNHTSVNLALSFPLPGRLNGYIEYVNGYGETLIDYNHRNKRIGIGVILNDWY